MTPATEPTRAKVMSAVKKGAAVSTVSVGVLAAVCIPFANSIMAAQAETQKRLSYVEAAQKSVERSVEASDRRFERLEDKIDRILERVTKK